MVGYSPSFTKPWFAAARTTQTKATKEGEEIMKTIVAIVLIGLLGFIGCSGSDDGTNTVGEAIPVAPFGIIETPSPTYEWTPVPGATKYRLVVQDTNEASTMQDTQETYIIDEWYTAEESGCASEDGLCMVTPDIEVFEENTWKVQACVNTNCGQWSESLDFDFSAMDVPRFTDHGDGTVTDNKKKLIWSKNAGSLEKKNWSGAKSSCEDLTLAGHSDWRLPSISELKSLIDTSQYDPALPPGNPFVNVQYGYYWSSTTYESDPSNAWDVIMYDGLVTHDPKDKRVYVWPVRSGS